jgi:uncharacterized protein YjbI with pentapeptide repeats
LDEQAHLPIANLDVPFSAFVPIASLIAIFFFIYFQIHLQALMEEIVAHANDYAPLDQRRLRPWTINFALEREQGLLGKLQTLIARFSLWWLLPTVLFLFTIWTFKKHNQFLSIVEFIISICGVILVGGLWYRFESLKPKAETSGEPTKQLKISPHRYLGMAIFGLVALATHLFLMYNILVVANLGPSQSFLYPYLFSINLSGQSLVNEQKEEDGVFWVDLHETNLEGAYLNLATLTHANLRESHLRWANLNLAELTKADFTGADLKQASLYAAKLPGAILYLADLQGVSFYKANLHGANLAATKLQKANLSQADLQEANLQEANLENADLTGAKLKDADLTSAVLLRANLTNADLTGANLMNANFRGATIKADQLAVVLTLYQAELEPELKSEITNRYPHLLEKPAR